MENTSAIDYYEFNDDESVLADNATDPNDYLPTLFDTYPDDLLNFGAAACIFISLWGIPANLVTIVAFARSPKMRNATVAFIINLCVADAIFCVFTPPLAASTFIHRRWIHGDFLCKVFPVMRYSNFAVSLLTVVIIAVNRYVLIAYPKKYPKVFSKFRIGVTIACLWLSAFGLLFPPAIGVWGSLGFDPKTGTCTILPKNGKSPKNMLFVLCLVIPSVTLCICYSRIYILVRNASKSVRGHDDSERALNSPRSAENSQDNSAETPQPSRKLGLKGVRLINFMKRKSYSFTQVNHRHLSLPKLSKEMKVLRMILVLFFSYILCFVPISLVKLFSKENESPAVNVLGYISVYANACVNPLIYVVMSREYRGAYKSLLTCRPADFFSGNSD